MDLQFKGKYILRGELCCVTGLHIGGSTEGIEIGGVDNPVIKDPLSEYPYIPGSTLKGKLRGLLEWSLGKNSYTGKHHHFTEGRKPDKSPTFGPCSCGRCEACRLFGVTPQSGVGEEGEAWWITGPARLSVRDAFPTGYREYVESNGREVLEGSTLAKWEEWLGGGVYTEIKTENAIDRVTSEANPRPMERVPAGSAFRCEMVFDVYRDDDRSLLKSLFSAMRLLENSALGGSGSRGHGQVRFEKLSLEWRPLDYYKTGKGIKAVPLPGKTVESIAQGFETIQWP